MPFSTIAPNVTGLAVPYRPAWLANRLAPYGEKLAAGENVLAGSFTAPVFAKPGDTFHIDYGPLGTISTRFA